MGTSFTDFTFCDDEGDASLHVTIPEIANEHYGLYIWPCSPVLAQYIWQRRSDMGGKCVLELGAGTALPGIVAAKCGAVVTLSDIASNKHCLDWCRKSVQSNSLSDVKVVGITWGQISEVLVNITKLDVILASDCFYDTKDFEDVLMTIAFLLEKNPNAEVWCAYQVRSSDRTIQHLLLKWGLSAEELVYPNMTQLESEYDKYKAADVELYVIKKKL